MLQELRLLNAHQPAFAQRLHVWWLVAAAAPNGGGGGSGGTALGSSWTSVGPL